MLVIRGVPGVLGRTHGRFLGLSHLYEIFFLKFISFVLVSRLTGFLSYIVLLFRGGADDIGILDLGASTRAFSRNLPCCLFAFALDTEGIVIEIFRLTLTLNDGSDLFATRLENIVILSLLLL